MIAETTYFLQAKKEGHRLCDDGLLRSRPATPARRPHRSNKPILSLEDHISYTTDGPQGQEKNFVSPYKKPAKRAKIKMKNAKCGFLPVAGQAPPEQRILTLRLRSSYSKSG